MAVTKPNHDDEDAVQTDTGEPIAESAAPAADSPLAAEQRAITSPEVDEDGIHRGITGPPKGANSSVDDGSDPNRPNINALGRDVKYPHQLDIKDHDVVVEDVEATKDADVKAERGRARTSATDTPGEKR